MDTISNPVYMEMSGEVLASADVSIAPGADFSLETPIATALLNATKFPLANIKTNRIGQPVIFNTGATSGYADVCFRLAGSGLTVTANTLAVFLFGIGCTAWEAFVNTSSATGAPNNFTIGGVNGTDATWSRIGLSAGNNSPVSNEATYYQYQGDMRLRQFASITVKYLWIRFRNPAFLTNAIQIGRAAMGLPVDFSSANIGSIPGARRTQLPETQDHDWRNEVVRTEAGQFWTYPVAPLYQAELIFDGTNDVTIYERRRLYYRLKGAATPIIILDRLSAISPYIDENPRWGRIVGPIRTSLDMIDSENQTAVASTAMTFEQEPVAKVLL